MVVYGGSGIMFRMKLERAYPICIHEQASTMLTG